MAKIKDLEFKQGKTYLHEIRVEEKPVIYKDITGITNTAPVRLTVPTHGLVNGWPAAVTNVKGMVEINAEANNVKDSDYHPATVVSSDAIEFNDINAAGFKKYVAGGVLQYNTPTDLSGCTARMSVKDKVGGTELFRLDDQNGRIVLNNTSKTVTLKVSASDTALMSFKKGVYELELETPTGEVFLVMSGAVTVTKEIAV